MTKHFTLEDHEKNIRKLLAPKPLNILAERLKGLIRKPKRIK